MIDVMAFLIKHFHSIQVCPSGDDLGSVLENAGFSDREIGTMILFVQLLNDMPMMADFHAPQQALRIYCRDETETLPAAVRAMLHTWQQDGTLLPAQREFVIHALMHLPYDEITVETAKMLVVLALWAAQSEDGVAAADGEALLYGNGLMH
ncbi:DUF494 family protein [Conchiformibius steedae DSM 2580]|uniref:Protein Smg homolog n=1 Tax=Conchiformibius steedae DSM 2580 TaxID=1121352 RepID=A0AAE9HV52_9NEIS|nr:DUF494 family protein [Conchiformibius steedae]QMT34009.1 DUF494 family protein [Conchiformibius steedae]URD66780.1 DUF494 family protein [Conchiformibius steedae DSM 2580]